MPEPTKLDQLLNKVSKIEELLTGNGDPSKGMIVRLDRMEQKLVPDAEVRLASLEKAEQGRTDREKARAALAWSALTASLGAVGTTLWGKLTGKA